ncbi:calmodulin-interacting protein 111 isoform X2 [Olea europaea var. sylvestris]|uniref:calmodulin-interacting protein 111 isoform X2 n=1 Tax=Olea europaea var. sylvestris TaxID=158386 RepID=UPI000C1D4E1D|nr:calmodulin-interacting protein 111 isoform X2 [Olea europaea var. sylvestris]XP_022852374.1 calmodulin-interacting protein 111 isoform X2 [Olea europaea var. sylvestris]
MNVLGTSGFILLKIWLMKPEITLPLLLYLLLVSIQVLKNGVRLSSNLSCTMGCPVPDRIVFVNPVKCQPLTNNWGKSYGPVGSSLSLDICKELHLLLVSSKKNFTMESTASTDLDMLRGTPKFQVRNSKISTPKTPLLLESKLRFPPSNHVESASENILVMEEVLGDAAAKKLLQTCIASWLCSRVFLYGNLVMVPVLSGLCIFQVMGSGRLSASNEIQHLTDNTNHILSPRAPCIEDTNYAFSVDQGTKIHLQLPGNAKDIIGVNFTKLGGLSKEFASLKDNIIRSVVKATDARYGFQPMRGVLLHGPPGTGKTSLALSCAHDAGVNLFSVNGREITDQKRGDGVEALLDIFDIASQAAPAVVFIDELHAIAPARNDGGDELSHRMVAALFDLMDGINRTNGIFIIAATNKPDSIDPALRRPGRLDKEIEIGVPSPMQRYEILLALLSDVRHSLLDEDIRHLAETTHGFVGADLAALCETAIMVHLQQYVNLEVSCGDSDCEASTTACDTDCQTPTHSCNVYSDGDIDASCNLENTQESKSDTAFSSISEMQNSAENLPQIKVNGTCDVEEDNLRVTFEDFKKAREKAKPSAMREVKLDFPKVGWEDVGGQSVAKTELMQTVLWPQKHKDSIKRIGTHPPSGILLFGPPGCSKTLLARVVACEAGWNFYAVKGPQLYDKWVGESEKNVKSLFQKARATAPSIIFFDEIDGLVTTRGEEGDGVSVGDRVITQLLNELDGVRERVDVTIIAATNRPDKIDPALLRPGRFDRLLYIGLPDEKDREDIFRVHLRSRACSSEVCIEELACLTEGYTGAEIKKICNDAGVAALEEDPTDGVITMEHLKAVIQEVQPSDYEFYEKLSTEFLTRFYSTPYEKYLAHQPRSRKPNEISFWSLIQSTVRFLYRLPKTVFQQDSS